jgi:hypothetical protein
MDIDTFLSLSSRKDIALSGTFKNAVDEDYCVLSQVSFYLTLFFGALHLLSFVIHVQGPREDHQQGLL